MYINIKDILYNILASFRTWCKNFLKMVK